MCDVHTKELSGFIISLFYIRFELLRELLHLYRWSGVSGPSYPLCQSTALVYKPKFYLHWQWIEFVNWRLSSHDKKKSSIFFCLPHSWCKNKFAITYFWNKDIHVTTEFSFFDHLSKCFSHATIVHFRMSVCQLFH